MGLEGLSIRFPTELREQVDAEATKEDRSRSNMIVILVREALAERARKAQEAQRE
jgi:metal-responsive CopG/Arc/MetJ family transcriptional regulator